jgi:hypothetical protein
VNETARYEWMTCRARADRWKEEKELLQEEMRRVVVFLDWKSRTWSEKVGVRVDSCAPDIQHGVDAYARKQAYVCREIAISFASQWLPYLKSCGYETKWSENLSWVSQALSRNTKLPRWFRPIPADTPQVLLATNSPPAGSKEGSGITQGDPDHSAATNQGGGHEEHEHGEHHNQIDDYDGFSNEEGGSGDEYEGYSEDSDEASADYEGWEDNAETNDEPGFEYDDVYMS